MSVEALISQVRASASADSAWLGSPEHLRLLADSLEPVFKLSGVSLAWGQPGQQSYWEAETQTIVLERPIPSARVSPRVLAKVTVLSLLHEALHARFSGPAPRYRENLARTNPVLRRATEMLFNLIEDGRVAKLATAEEPELGPSLDEFATTAVEQIEKVSRPNGPTVKPESASNQLIFGLMVYSLRQDRAVLLHPDVLIEVNGLRRVVDEAQGGSIEDCGSAAIALIERVSTFNI